MTVIGFPMPGPDDDDLAASMSRHPAGRALPIAGHLARPLLAAVVDQAADRARNGCPTCTPQACPCLDAINTETPGTTWSPR